MILLISNERDLTSDYIVLELQRKGVQYFRLNTERLPEATLCMRPALPNNKWELTITDRTLDLLNEVSAAYFRRPAMPIPLPNVSGVAERNYCEQEWSSILRSLYTVLENRWLNSPKLISVAEDKPFQISIASSIGLRVPETLITNNYNAAKDFVSGGTAIGKPLHTALLNGAEGKPDRVIFTSRLDMARHFTPESIKAAPIILQREIAKKFDIRATVVGNEVFTVAIQSQNKIETSVDWRRGSHADLPHIIHELPHDITQMCIAIVKQLGLRFAAVDLILDEANNYWFLEANPNGQWAWIENRTGLPISSAIVSELLAIRLQIAPAIKMVAQAI